MAQLKLRWDLQLCRLFTLFTMVYGVLIFICIIVYNCGVYIFGASVVRTFISVLFIVYLISFVQNVEIL
jgi:hypothetical protein